VKKRTPFTSVAVVGAGAVGTFYGAKLQKLGLSVEYFTRSAKAREKRTIKIKSIWGDFSISCSFFSNAKLMKKADLIILSTKNLPDIDYASMIKPVSTANSVILCLNNGINLEEKLKYQFKKNAIIGGLAFTCINRVSTTKIDHLDYGHVKVGAMQKTDTKYAREISRIFNKAGVRCEHSYPLRKLRWEKLLWNIPYNPLSVVLKADTAALMNHVGVKELSKAIMKEVRLIAASENCGISMRQINDMVARTAKMRPYKTSMILDHESGLPLEVDALLGEPLRIARKNRVAVPKIEALYALTSFHDTPTI